MEISEIRFPAPAHWIDGRAAPVDGPVIDVVNPFAPFGGYKQSGNGREYGRQGLEEFLETKAIQR
jgi:acyl-CoA reductase-like NAD-dependent aldehyde dehydrogenase